MTVTIRSAIRIDLPRLTEIHNYYVAHTHITFDVQTFTPEQRLTWLREHSDGQRYRLLVAESAGDGLVGYATTGRFRAKAAYDTTVEVSIACAPEAKGRGIGTQLMRRFSRPSKMKTSTAWLRVLRSLLRMRCTSGLAFGLWAPSAESGASSGNIGT